jgi:hypothetical protein
VNEPLRGLAALSLQAAASVLGGLPTFAHDAMALLARVEAARERAGAVESEARSAGSVVVGDVTEPALLEEAAGLSKLHPFLFLTRGDHKGIC